MGALDPAAVVTDDGDAVVAPFQARGPGALEQLDAPGQEVLLEGGRHLRVLLRQDLLAADDERDLGAHRGEEVDELDAGHAGADDRDVLGQDLGRVGLAGRQDPVAVGLGPVRDAGPAPGAEEHGVGRDGDLAVAGVGHDRVGAGQATRAPQDADLLAIQQFGDRGLEPVLDGREPLPQGLQVDLGPDLAEAHLLDLVQVGQGPTRGDHGLGGDAVPQVGGAADDVPLDQGDLGPQGRRPGGGGVARRPSTDDHEALRHPVRLSPV